MLAISRHRGFSRQHWECTHTVYGKNSTTRIANCIAQRGLSPTLDATADSLDDKEDDQAWEAVMHRLSTQPRLVPGPVREPEPEAIVLTIWAEQGGQAVTASDVEVLIGTQWHHEGSKANCRGR
jgi:hypothetical protein